MYNQKANADRFELSFDNFNLLFHIFQTHLKITLKLLWICNLLPYNAIAIFVSDFKNRQIIIRGR